MYETHLTAVGRVASPVERKQFADGAVKASFRVACNERRRDRTTAAWVNGDSLYLSVTCWRLLAENVHASLVVGDPVIVRGRLHTREYDKDGRRNSVVELEASAVGPDLKWSTATVTRSKPGSGVAAPPATTADDGTASTAVTSRPAPPEDGWRSGPLVDLGDGGPSPGRAPSRDRADGRAAGPAEVVEAGVGA